MFGIGLLEIAVIAVAGLIFVGPQNMPQLARQLGRFFVQIRRLTGEVKSTVDDAIRSAEHDLLLEEKAKLQALADQVKTEVLENTDENKLPESEPYRNPKDHSSAGDT